MCWRRRRRTLFRGIISRRGIDSVRRAGGPTRQWGGLLGFRGRAYFVPFTIDLMNGVAISLIDQVAWRGFILQRTHFLTHSNQPMSYSMHIFPYTYTMRSILHNLMRVLEAPLAHIQPVCSSTTDHILGVERRVPWLDVEVSEHDVGYIRRHWRSVGSSVW